MEKKPFGVGHTLLKTGENRLDMLYSISKSAIECRNDMTCEVLS